MALTLLTICKDAASVGNILSRDDNLGTCIASTISLEDLDVACLHSLDIANLDVEILSRVLNLVVCVVLDNVDAINAIILWLLSFWLIVLHLILSSLLILNSILLNCHRLLSLLWLKEWIRDEWPLLAQVCLIPSVLLWILLWKLHILILLSHWLWKCLYAESLALTCELDIYNIVIKEFVDSLTHPAILGVVVCRPPALTQHSVALTYILVGTLPPSETLYRVVNKTCLLQLTINKTISIIIALEFANLNRMIFNILSLTLHKVVYLLEDFALRDSVGR